MAWGPSRSSLSARRPFQSPLLARRPCWRHPSASPCRCRPSASPCRRRPKSSPCRRRPSASPKRLALPKLLAPVLLGPPWLPAKQPAQPWPPGWLDPPWSAPPAPPRPPALGPPPWYPWLPFPRGVSSTTWA